MATKTITVTKEAYEALASEKKPGESFSQVLIRTHKKKGDISGFIGAWSHMSDEVAERIKKDVEDMRKSSAKRLLERTNGI